MTINLKTPASTVKSGETKAHERLTRIEGYSVLVFITLAPVSSEIDLSKHTEHVSK